VAKLTSKKTSKLGRASRPHKRVPASAKTAPRPLRTAKRNTPVGSSKPVRKNDSPQAPPLPGIDKPVKNKIGLKPRDLAFFRDLLLAKRRELVGDVHSMEEEALQSSNGSNLSNLPIHMADMGTDNYEQEFTLGLVEKDRKLLREINLALGKLRDGTYGVCEGTGKPITRARLEAQPWARYSIEYARQVEKGIGPT